jgi:tyrosyl-tRNA synthetase
MPLFYELLLGAAPDPSLEPVARKRRLGRALTARFHSDAAAAEAEARFDRLHVERRAPSEIEEAPLPPGDPVHLPALLADGFGVSRAQARRLLAQGGVRLDGQMLQPDELEISAERLDGAVLQVGKRRFKRLRAASSAPAVGSS